MNNKNTDDDQTVIYTGSSSPSARLVCLDTMLDDCLRSLDIRLGVQDETLGRSDNNSISIKYNKMSRNHARISFENSKWTIEDLNSANGIYINEQQVDKAAMGQGDIVVIGQVPFRFEIESAPPGMEQVDQSTPADDYVGDSGTMYAQHVGVIESLASTDDPDEEQLNDLPPPPEIQSTQTPPPASSHYEPPPAKKGNGFAKIISLFLFVSILGGGYWYWQSNAGNKQSDQLYKTYSKDVQLFLEQIESTNTITPDAILTSEINELQGIAARVDVAAEQASNHSGLESLKRKLAFLIYERKLSLLLQNDSLYDAEHLINETRTGLKVSGNSSDNTTEDFSGLMALSETAVQFKRFSDQYSNPAPDSGKQPDQYDLSKMLEIKSDFISLKKQNYQNLSVVYTRLHQLLERVEEKDIRILNRWQEIRKRSG